MCKASCAPFEPASGQPTFALRSYCCRITAARSPAALKSRSRAARCKCCSYATPAASSLGGNGALSFETSWVFTSQFRRIQAPCPDDASSTDLHATRSREFAKDCMLLGRWKAQSIPGIRRTHMHSTGIWFFDDDSEGAIKLPTVRLHPLVRKLANSCFSRLGLSSQVQTA